MKIKKLISLLLISIMLVASVSGAFAVTPNQNSDSEVVTGTQNNDYKSVDPSTVAPIDPTITAKNPAIRTITIKNPNINKTNDPLVNTLSSLPAFATISIKASSDLRTITVTVNTTGIITPIISFSGYVNVRNYNGTCTSSTQISGSLFYDKTWTITKPITSTVEENITLQSCGFNQALDDYTVPEITTIRTNQIGGSYNSILSAMGGERHHLIAKQVIDSATIYKYDSNRKQIGTVTSGTAPCILMTPIDHQKTSSYKSSAAAIAYRAKQLELVKQGKYVAAMQMEIDDIHANIGTKYDIAISDAWVYMIGLGWYK